MPFLASQAVRWLAGTVDEVAARIEELRQLGMTGIFLQHLNHSDDAMLELVRIRSWLPGLGVRLLA